MKNVFVPMKDAVSVCVDSSELCVLVSLTNGCYESLLCESKEIQRETFDWIKKALMSSRKTACIDFVEGRLSCFAIAEKEQVMIQINGKLKQVEKGYISYTEVLALTKHLNGATVTARLKKGNTLDMKIINKGEGVELQEGMIFSVADTSKA